jgi:hypothetical protein
MSLELAENPLTLSQLLHGVLPMILKQRRRRGGSVPVGGGHAGGRGARVVHQESVLGIRRRAGGPKGGPPRWGGGAQWSRQLRPGRARAAVGSRPGEEPGWCSSGLGRAGAAAWTQQRWLGQPKSEGRRRTVGRREEMAGGGCRGMCTGGGRRIGAQCTRGRRHRRLREESRRGDPRWLERQWRLLGVA